jgi:hypothetical protein
MEITEGEITVLSIASPNSKSLRSTVPMSIVKQFGLSSGDKLNWQIKAQGDEIIIIVKPIKIKD